MKEEKKRRKKEKNSLANTVTVGKHTSIVLSIEETYGTVDVKS